ncbi:NEW3 domain-containing protein [Massilia aurea]|uniref:NEW3 domain-containing protein n=1 Tax=Massilia aurea TaxID=373040 RepID=UPI003462CE06
MKTRLKLVAAAALLAAANGAYAATAAGTVITNQATATYNDSTGTKTVQSNTVITTVQQVASLTMPAGTAKSAGAGTSVTYAHSVTNTGNGSDTFALSQTNTGTLNMTGVVFYLDANGDGVADNATPITTTGPLAPGATFRFVAVATLPAGATNGTTNALTVRATSGFNGSVNATSIDTTTTSAGAVIDITANSAGAGAPGAGPGVEAAAVETKTTTAGTMTSFVLFLNNTGGSPDTFSLAASTDATFGTTVLPSGWTVVFKDVNGAVITNATVAAGGNFRVTAEVTPPAGTAPGTTDLYFRAISGTGVADRIHEAVTVAAADSLVELVKTQALDANCDGVADTAFSNAPITTGAVPGACIRYQIVGTNKGVTTINLMVMNDTVPANTTYHAGAPANTLLGSIVAPLAGLIGNVSATVGNLAPGQSNTMAFGVKID